MEKEYKMSAARAQELQEELNYLKTTRSDEVAEQIKIARGFGDLSENSEYDEAKNEQGKLYSRIAELEEILEHAVIVEESADNDVVSIGWTALLIVLMLMYQNDYTLKQTFKTIFLTLFCVLVVVALIVVLYMLISQLVDFIVSIYGEVVYRFVKKV